LRDALKCVLDDPPPVELTLRAIHGLRQAAVRYPRKPRSRIISWMAPVIAASIVWIALTACFWAAEYSSNRAARMVRLTPPPEGAAAVLSDERPTAWTYAKAARQSPEALYALLDRQSHLSIAATSPLLASNDIHPPTSAHNATP